MSKKQIKVGSLLRLHDDELYEVMDLRLELEDARWVSVLEMRTDKGSVVELPIHVVESLLANGELYLHGQEELMKRYHEAKNKT